MKLFNIFKKWTENTEKVDENDMPRWDGTIVKTDKWDLNAEMPAFE